MFCLIDCKKTIKKKLGFSLVEIVVALSLLAVSLVAIISVINKVLQVEHVTENDFVAKGLLVEGIELAEAKRNANVAALSAFYTGLMSGSPAEGTEYKMRIDYLNNMDSVSALTDSLCQLKYDSSNFYQHTSGANSKFYRMLKNTYHILNGRDWIDVESQVYWVDRGKGATQKLSFKLYNTTP